MIFLLSTTCAQATNVIASGFFSLPDFVANYLLLGFSVIVCILPLPRTRPPMVTLPSHNCVGSPATNLRLVIVVAGWCAWICEDERNMPAGRDGAEVRCGGGGGGACLIVGGDFH